MEKCRTKKLSEISQTQALMIPLFKSAKHHFVNGRILDLGNQAGQIVLDLSELKLVLYFRVNFMNKKVAKEGHFLKFRFCCKWSLKGSLLNMIPVLRYTLV